MKRKILIGFLVAIVVWLGIVAFVVLKPSEPKEDVRVTWELLEDERAKLLRMWVQNAGDEPFNVTGVEAVYLPNSTVAWLWLEHHTVQPHTAKTFIWWGWVNETHNYPVENSPIRQAYYKLLDEGKWEAILEVTVATEKAIYTFYPEGYLRQTLPTTIEKIEEK